MVDGPDGRRVTVLVVRPPALRRKPGGRTRGGLRSRHGRGASIGHGAVGNEK
jgi:hypothetical protein